MPTGCAAEGDLELAHRARGGGPGLGVQRKERHQEPGAARRINEFECFLTSDLERGQMPSQPTNFPLIMTFCSNQRLYMAGLMGLVKEGQLLPW